MKVLYYLCCTVLALFVFWSVFAATTSPTYQQGLTARKQAVEQTKQVQAREFNSMLRTNGPWALGGLAVVFVVVAGGKVWMHHQEQRTSRYSVYEENTTQRHMITAKKDIALAYIAACGDPKASRGMLNGVDGVFLPGSGEHVPLSICKQELEQTALVRYEQPSIPVGLPSDNGGRVFRIVGEG